MSIVLTNSKDSMIAAVLALKFGVPTVIVNQRADGGKTTFRFPFEDLRMYADATPYAGLVGYNGTGQRALTIEHNARRRDLKNAGPVLAASAAFDRRKLALIRHIKRTPKKLWC